MANLTIADIRKKFPQYDDLSDQQLADSLHRKFYSDMDKGEFYGKIGFSTEPAKDPTPPAVQTQAPQQGAAPAIDDLALAMGAQPFAAPQTQAPTQPTVTPDPKTAIPARAMPKNPTVQMEGPGAGGGMNELYQQGILPRRYVEDPLAASMAPQASAQEDPFAGETFLDLAKRRGQQFVLGAVEPIAAVPEALAIANAGDAATKREITPEYLAGLVQQRDALSATLNDPDAQGHPMRSAWEREFENLNAEIAQAQEMLAQTQSLPASAMESGTFQKGDALRHKAEEVFGAPDPRDTSFWAGVAEGAGNMTTMAGSSIAASMIGTPVAGMAVGAGQGAAMNMSQLYKEALEAGASEEDARRAAKWGAAIGTTEIVPIGRALKLLPPRLRGEVGSRFFRAFSDILQSSGEEAAQEYLSQVANNLVASGIYDPERGWNQGAVEGALVGAILGGGMGAVGVAANRGRTEQVGDGSQTPPETPRAQPDPLLHAMGAQAGRVPQDAQPTQEQPQEPQDNAAAQPEQSAQQAAEAAQAAQEPQQDGGRFRIMDEVENVDGETVPTGRKVRVNLDTGEVSPVESSASSQSEDEAVQSRTQEAPVVGSDVAPVSGDAAQKQDTQAQSEEEAAGDAGSPEDNAAGEEYAGTIRVETLPSEAVANIETDAKTFQYKDNGDEHGVTERLQGVKDWDERSAMGGIVYEYADGRRVVADGHQRLGLAKRLQENGIKTPWNVEIIREVDGFTPADVRRLAALKNIREGSGTAVDAAKVLREAPDDIENLNLPPKSALVRDAKGLAKLSDDAFGMVVNEVVKPEWGAVVGENVANKAVHADVISLLKKLNPSNNAQAAMIAQQAGQQATTETQGSLFGDEEVSQSLYLERAKVLDGALKRLKRDKQTFKVLADRADTITEAGNVLNSEANAQRVEADSKAAAYLTAEANRKGYISDALTAAAKDLKANPRQSGRIVREFLDAIRQADNQPQEGGPDRSGADPAGTGNETQLQAERDQVSEPAKAEDASDFMGAVGDIFGETEQAEPATSQTQDDDQATLAGFEPDPEKDAQARAADQRRELEARAKQSKMRTTAEQDDAGPLFGDSSDLFSAGNRPHDPEPIAEPDSKAGQFVDVAPEWAQEVDFTDLSDSFDGFDPDNLGNDARDYVLENGKKDSVEYLVMINEGGEIVSIGKGTKSDTGVSKGMTLVFDPAQNIVVHHNHPQSVSFSAADLAYSAMPGLHAIYAHGHDGTTFRAKATDLLRAAYDGKAATKENYAHNAEQLSKLLNLLNRMDTNFWKQAGPALGKLLQSGFFADAKTTKTRGGKVRQSSYDAGRFHKAALALAMRDAGLIDLHYENDTFGHFDPDKNPFLFDPQLKKVYERLVTNLKDRFADQNIGDSDVRRSANERHVGDVAGILDGNAEAAPGEGEPAPSSVSRSDQEGEGRNQDEGSRGGVKPDADFLGALDDVYGEDTKAEDAPKAEDFPELNFEDTGGQYGRKRLYPGYVISKIDTGYSATREGETTPVVSAKSLDGLKDMMGMYRNPYTGEAFKKPAAKPKTKVAPKASKESPTGVDYPNRKLGFRYARTSHHDQYNDMVWFNIAAANLRKGDVIPARGIGMFPKGAVVESVTEKTLTVTDRDTGKKVRLNPNSNKWEQLTRDAGGVMGASHQGVDAGDLVTAFLRDPAASRDESGVLQLVDVDEATTAPKAAPKPKRSKAEIARDMQDILRGLKEDSREMQTDGTSDEKYSKLSPLFVEALDGIDRSQYLRRGLFAEMIRPLADAGLTREDVIELYPYFTRFLDDVDRGIIDLDGGNDASSTGGDLEQDSGDASSGDGLGGTDVSVAAGRDGQSSDAGRGAADQGSGQRQGRGGVSDGDAAFVGTRGDQGVSTRKRGGRKSSKLGDSAGSRDRRKQGLPSDNGRTEDTTRHATDAPDVADRKAVQAKADTVKVIPGDRDNIDKTLPLLLPEQRDDVFKVEQRFAKTDKDGKPVGHGMLLTNGTGTGKTYSGGGVIKRFAQQGKDNILILAPSQGILDAWVAMGADMGLNITKLEDTKSAGEGIVATTYANAGENAELAKRDWDLVVSDESHKLSQNASGGSTAALDTVRAITNRPQDLIRRARMVHAKEWAEWKAMPGRDSDMLSVEQAERAQEVKDAKRAELIEKDNALVEKWQKAPRSKVLFLSATPFAYDKNVDYAEGYLFEYGADGVTDNGSRQDGRSLFMVENFGYRIRYHKLTKPEAAVDTGVFERQFHERLKREGVLSGRQLEVDADYDRKFVQIKSVDGEKIDAALKLIWENSDQKTEKGRQWYELSQHVRRNFTYLRRMQLLEAIKADKAIPDIKKHLALGRKVVVFHDYNKGGGFNPFMDGSVVTPTTDALEGYKLLLQEMPEVADLNFSGLGSPIETLKGEFGDSALVYNGTVSKSERKAAIEEFSRDDNGKNIIIVQSAAGEAGISLHDTTGGHQRALINLGMPVRPTTTLQEEGRIRRVGSVSDAIFRYYTTGTTWERQAFAGKIAEGSGTVENLALGDQARAIRDSFINAYMEADTFEPKEGEGKGGTELDRSVASVTPYEQAKTHYHARMKTNQRRDRRKGLDFYATPEPLGFKMAEWSGVRTYERILEPSAGDGAIARYFPADADRTIVEPSAELISRAQLRTPGAKAVQETFEDHHLVNKYDAVVMNPPFGSGGKTAMDHLAKAMRHVRPGGRVVALIPTGPAADKQFAKMLQADDFPITEWNFTADINLPAVTFEKAGTSVRSHVVIFDRVMTPENMSETQHINLTGADKIEDFFDRLEGIDVPARPEIATEDIAGETETSPAPVSDPDVFDTFEFQNTKTGEDMFGVQIKENLGDRFKEVSSIAKANGGYYSRYQNRAAGARRGFLFRSDSARSDFMADVQKVQIGLKEDIHSLPVLPYDANPEFRQYGAEFYANSEEHFAALGLTDSEVERIAHAYEAMIGDTSSEAFNEALENLQQQADDLVQTRVQDASDTTNPDGLTDLSKVRSKAALIDQHGDIMIAVRSQLDLDALAMASYADALGFMAYEEKVASVFENAAFDDPSRPLGRTVIINGNDFSAHGSYEELGEWAVRENAIRKALRKLTGVDEVFEAANMTTKPVGLSESLSPRIRYREGDPAQEALRAAMGDLRAALDRMNLKRVKLSLDESGKRLGAFRVDTSGALEILIAPSLDPEGTLYHESIHAMRALDLFTPQEWRALEIKAAKTWVDQYDIAKRYPDLLPSEQIEEAIAEAFSDAVKTRKAPQGSILLRAFNKMARVLKALGNALRGAGFQTVNDVFGRAMSGEVGARDAGNGFVAAMEKEARFPAYKRLTAAQRAQQQAHLATSMGANGGYAFIPDRRIWEELTLSNASYWERLKGGAAAANDWVDKARIKIQDRFLPVLRAQEAIIRSTGAPLPESHNAYLAEETFSGKVGRHLFEIDEEYTKPIIDIMAGGKGEEMLDMDYVGTWLYARHAKERNAQIASINPDMQDGGSGMTNAEADQILADAAAGPNATRLQRIGYLVDKLRERTLKLREDAGLITPDEADLWRNQYDYYVPLKGFADTDHSEAMLDVTGIGRRFNTRGAESKRALGRQSEAFNPLQGAITQAQEVAIRAEKNRVGQKLYKLAKDFPSPELWSIKTPKQKLFYNRTTGLVETRVEDPVSLFMDPNEMAVKVGGKERRIIFHDIRLAEAAGTVGADQMNWFIAMMSKASRFFSSVNTMLDPEFVIRNAFRDMTAAQINIRNFGEGDRNKLAKAMIKNWPKAWRAAYRGQLNKVDSEWGNYYREFDKAGAKVSFWKLEQPEAEAKDMEKRVKMAGGNVAQRASRFVRFSTRDNPVLGFIERVNLAVDNAVRLAAYVEARKQGWSKAEAASLSKNLTVNFNRRGEWGASINALYPFANAGIQGTQILFKAMTSKRMAKYALGMVALGILLDQVNAAMSDEDDDGELAYDKIPDWKNQMNLVVMLGPDADNAATVWLPYGYNLFPYMGQQISKIMRGVKKPTDAMADFAGAMFGAFSPITGGSVQSVLTPTMLDPVNEMAMNQDWLGLPIRPESPYSDYGPDAYKYYSGVSSVSRELADAMNKATGGTIAEPGFIDVSPEYIDHAFGFMTGGAGRFVGRTTDTIGKLMRGEFDDIEERNIPFYRSLQYETGDWLDRDRYYRFREEVMEARDAMQTYQEAGMPVPAHVRRMAGLYDANREAEKILRKMRATSRAIAERDDLSAAEISRRRAQIDEQAQKVYLGFNKTFIRANGPQGE